MGQLATLSALTRNRLHWLRLTPFDQSTSTGRQHERHRRMALSAMTSALSKAMSIIATLFSIPLALGYLGSERFGVWATLSSLVITLQFADLGIGNGLINTVSTAYGAGDRKAIQRYVSSGAVALLAIALVMLLAVPALTLYVPWQSVFKITDPQTAAEVGPAVVTFIACTALAIPLGVVQRVQIALQRGFVASLWQCVANLASLFFIWLAVHLQLSLSWLVLALLGAPLLAALINSAHFFGLSQPDIRPRLRSISGLAMKQLAATGSQFLGLQIAVAVVLNSDSIVIAHVLGAAAVTQYAIPEKIFGVVTVILSTVLSPLWPAYGEAVARGDADWILRTLKRSVIAATCFAVTASLVLGAIGPFLIREWVGTGVVVSASLIWSMGLWKALEGSGLALAMFLNGAGVIRAQLVMACAMVVCVIYLKPAMVQEWGVFGAPLSTAIIYFIAGIVPSCLILPAIVARIRRKAA